MNRITRRDIVDLADGRCRDAETLARSHREGDETIRPDVFVPLAEDTGQATDRTLAIPHASSRVAPTLTASAGVGCITPDETRHATQGVAAADRALYQAKRGGRDRVAIAAADTAKPRA